MLQHSISSACASQIQRLGGMYVPEDEWAIYRERQVKRSRSAALKRKQQAEQLQSPADYFRNVLWPDKTYRPFGSPLPTDVPLENQKPHLSHITFGTSQMPESLLARFADCPYIVIGEAVASTSHQPTEASTSANAAPTYLLLLSTESSQDLDNPVVQLLDPQHLDASPTWWTDDRLIPHEYLASFLASLEPENDRVFSSISEIDSFVEDQLKNRFAYYLQTGVAPVQPAATAVEPEQAADDSPTGSGESAPSSGENTTSSSSAAEALAALSFGASLTAPFNAADDDQPASSDRAAQSCCDDDEHDSSSNEAAPPSLDDIWTTAQADWEEYEARRFHELAGDAELQARVGRYVDQVATVALTDLYLEQKKKQAKPKTRIVVDDFPQYRLHVQNQRLASFPARSMYALHQHLVSLNVESNLLSSLPNLLGLVTRLEYLILRENRLSSLPADMGSLKRLHYLDASRNRLRSLPASLMCLRQLEYVSLAYNQIESLPLPIEEDSYFLQVAELVLDSNCLQSLPPAIGYMTSLRTLRLCSNRLSSLPVELGGLPLVELNLRGNDFHGEVPAVVFKLTSLRRLWLSYNSFDSVPRSCDRLANLRVLDLHHNQLQQLPDEFGRLHNLERLMLQCNSFRAIPPVLCAMASLRSVDVSSNPLAVVPAQLAQLDCLFALQLSAANISAIPDALASLRRLVRLDLSSNKLEQWPSCLLHLSALQSLELMSCSLSSLPDELGSAYPQLCTLDLSRNAIASLPPSLAMLTKLSQLDLSDNKIDQLPFDLTSLPSLKYLALAGNPCHQAQQASGGDLPWSFLT